MKYKLFTTKISMLKSAFRMCFLLALFVQKIQNSTKIHLGCIEMPISENQEDLNSIFRSGTRRTSKMPKSITFKTKIGMSSNFVNNNFYGSARKAKRWVKLVIQMAEQHFQHHTLDTKVKLKIMEYETYRMNGHATEQNIEELQFVKESTRDHL